MGPTTPRRCTASWRAEGIEPVVKPRRNARLDTGPRGRRRAVGQVRRLGYEE